MSRRTLAIILCTTVAVLGVLFVVFVKSLSTHEISYDPLKYQSCLGHFRSEYVAMLPPAIPQDALMRYDARGGLGPGSLRLSVSYRTEPAEAERILAAARKRAQAMNPPRNMKDHEAEALAGDDWISLTADPETGAVAFTISRN